MVDVGKNPTGKSKARQKAGDRVPLAADILDRVSQGHSYAGVDVTDIKFKLPGDPMAEILCIATGLSDDGTPVVAFHSAVGFVEAFVGLAVRLQNGTLKWRVDEYRLK